MVTDLQGHAPDLACYPVNIFRVALRTILYVNFFLAALFVAPMTHRWADRGFLLLRSRSIDWENAAGWSLEGWIVGSTLAATVLFACMACKYRRTPNKSVRFEGILLLAWWLTVLCFCVYGFALGLGG